MSEYKEKKATALSYDPSRDLAPKVVAQAKGRLASHVVQIAKMHNVSVVCDPELSALTSALPVHSEIPENLYTAVAGILGMILKAKGKLA